VMCTAASTPPATPIPSCTRGKKVAAPCLERTLRSTIDVASRRMLSPMPIGRGRAVLRAEEGASALCTAIRTEHMSCALTARGTRPFATSCTMRARPWAH